MTVFTIISYNNNDWIVWILFPNIIIIYYIIQGTTVIYS